MDNEKEIVGQVTDTAPETAEVVGIQFKVSGKTYYFDPVGQIFALGAHAIVETARGLEYGYVSMGNTVVSGKELVLPLRKVLRAATEEKENPIDKTTNKENEPFRIYAKPL